MICNDSGLFTSSFDQKMLRMFVLKLQQQFEKGVRMKLCITDKGQNLTLNSTVPLSRSLNLILYADEMRMWFRGFFFQISNKKQTMPPSGDVCCFIMHDVCKEECDHVGNPSGVANKGTALLPTSPHTHTKAHILNMLHIGSSG